MWALTTITLTLLLAWAGAVPMPMPLGASPPAPQSGHMGRRPMDVTIRDAMAARPGGAPSDPLLMEMDMRLTDAQWQSLYGPQRTRDGVSHIAISAESYRWISAIIPYVIDKVFSTAQRNQIRTGMDEWENFTCVRFVPRSNEPNYVSVISADGCWSSVGMVGGKQELSLQRSGCLGHHTIVHEFGHAIGFHHEQTRPDRDNYIKVNNDNIESGLAYNFDKYKWGYVKNYGIRYDYWSIMHYSQWAFSRNGKPTISTLDKAYREVIGNSPGVSVRDVQTVLLMYRCSDQCDRSRCPANSIVGKDCRCWCSTGIPGRPVVEWDGSSECKDANADTDPCSDYRSDCDRRARAGECDSNPSTMLIDCRRSCRICGPNPVCKDYRTECTRWSLKGECETNPTYMHRVCRRSCFVCGNVQPSGCSDQVDLCRTAAANGDCEMYRDSMLARCPRSCKACLNTPEFVCRNWHVECPQWAQHGRCNAEPDYMRLHCPKACELCTGNTVPDCKNYASDTDCARWTESGECATNPSWMLFMCAKSCRACGSDKACIDRRSECSRWSTAGYCRDVVDGPNLYFYCPVSCSHCTPEGDAPDPNCQNFSPWCDRWAHQGRCDSNPDLMLWSCAKSCQICGAVRVCKNYNAKCQEWASSGECQANPTWMSVACAKACNTCNRTIGGVTTTTTPATTTTTITTTPTTVTTTTRSTTTRSTTTRSTTTTTGSTTGEKDCNDFYRSTFCELLINSGYRCLDSPTWMLRNCRKSCRACGPNALCRNFHTSCVQWAERGECQANPSYMELYCRKECSATCRAMTTITTTTTPASTTLSPISTTLSAFDSKWCVDYDVADCQRRERAGECTTNRSYMFGNCANTCRVCGPGSDCKNYKMNCDYWAKGGHCDRSPSYMKIYCRPACGVCS